MFIFSPSRGLFYYLGLVLNPRAITGRHIAGGASFFLGSKIYFVFFFDLAGARTGSEMEAVTVA